MKDSLRVGLTHGATYTVDESRVTSILGADMKVYGTPYMIRDIERTCRDLILTHAEAGEDSVGLKVEVEHLAPALPGQEVKVAVRLIERDNRRLRFEASVRDQFEELGRGFHDRFIVEIAKSRARQEKKRAQIQAAQSAANKPA
jgi:fluoroacetyl-CoA thioesterase